jgi:hypothetical protein
MVFKYYVLRIIIIIIIIIIMLCLLDKIVIVKFCFTIPGVDSASNRNEYQEYFLEGKGGRCVGLTTLPPSCADCHEIWGPQPAGTLRACPGL